MIIYGANLIQIILLIFAMHQKSQFKICVKRKLEIFQHTNHKFMFLDGYLWMWDTPQENELQENLAKKSFGDVLNAGYGFGILPKFLLENPKVKSITTVEIYKEVIDKMKEFGKIHGKIIIGDFYDLPENKKYDCVVSDIWPDIDAKFLG